MPKIYEYFGIIFFLYPNDHEPIHAHAISGENETIFELHFENGQLKEIKTRKREGKSISQKQRWNRQRPLWKNLPFRLPKNGTASTS